MAKYPREILTPAEVAQMLRATNQGPTGASHRALIGLLFGAGLRIGEALALKPGDLHPESGTITVKNGKTGPRTVACDPGTFGLVDAWMVRRKALGFTGHQPLLCTTKGKPINAGYVRRLLPRLARRAGITKRVHAHGLRHSHAVDQVRSGTNIMALKDQLGHSNVSTTSIYAEHAAVLDLAQQMKTREDWTK